MFVTVLLVDVDTVLMRIAWSLDGFHDLRNGSASDMNTAGRRMAYFSIMVFPNIITPETRTSESMDPC